MELTLSNNASPVLWTSLNDSGSTSYNVENTCTTIISSSSSFTLSSGTKYWLVFEYTTSPSYLTTTDFSTNVLNSSTDFKHSVNGTSWYNSPYYTVTSGSCSSISGHTHTSNSYRRMRLYLAE